MEKLCDGQIALIRKIAEENNFIEFEVCVKSGSEKGDNFSGIISNISIKHDDRQLDLVMKSAHPSKNSDYTILDAAYDTEMYAYETLFKEFDILQEEFNIKHIFNGYPKIYGCSLVSQSLAMEDIRKRGFKLWNKKLPMNSEHIIAVVKEYAKLHSLGMIMNIKKPELFEQISKGLIRNWMKFTEQVKNFDKGVIEKILQVVKSNKQATEVVLKFYRMLEEYNRFLEIPGYIMAFVHGDCWCNNMMFKYEDGSSSPTEVCLLDFQGIKAAMPASDLTYYLFCSLDKQELDNYKRYLNIYYSIVTDNLKSAGLNGEDIFPDSHLESQFKLSAFQGIIAASIIIQIVLGESDETPDINGDFERAKQLFTMKIGRQDEYEQRVHDLVLFMIEHDLFC